MKTMTLIANFMITILNVLTVRTLRFLQCKYKYLQSSTINAYLLQAINMTLDAKNMINSIIANSALAIQHKSL